MQFFFIIKTYILISGVLGVWDIKDSEG